MIIIKLILGTIILTGLDSFYLNFMKKKYMKLIANVQKENFKLNVFGLLMSYFFLVLGLYFLLKNNLDYTNAFLFGLIVYGVYDFTNLAIFNKWSLFLSIIDILWGGILFSLTIMLINFIFGRYYNPK
jgi:uncharacterized membrane protein